MNATTKRACVIGWPIEHSRSPLIHNYWIKQYKLDAEYGREAVKPEELPGFVRSLRERGYVGCNVTIPHKEAVFALTEPDNRADAVGAANTLFYGGDVLRSTNTDVEGFLGNLDQATPAWDRGLETAVVLGAGGGAKAVVFALLSREVRRIYLVNRTPARAEVLRKKFGSRSSSRQLGRTDRAARRRRAAGQYDVARHGRAAAARDQSARPARRWWSPTLSTRRWRRNLLKVARDRGLRTADGLGMLLHQAVRGFQLWFGVRPEVTPELRALVEKDLLKS